jgi:tripartite-type tricarboxylate transporter receptor subunit TctC
VPASEPMSRRMALGAISCALAVPLVGVPAAGRAQPGTDWPSQPVRYINPFPPGGATDTLSRLWCAKMSEITGQQFVVENRSGSGGNVGVDVVAKSRPDGTTTAWAVSPRTRSRRPSMPACPLIRCGTSPSSPASGACPTPWW